MKVHKELRGPRPNTMYTLAHGARRFLAYIGKPPVAVTAEDVEGERHRCKPVWRAENRNPAASAATPRGAGRKAAFQDEVVGSAERRRVVECQDQAHHDP
jgi:hypothetical protein